MTLIERDGMAGMWRKDEFSLGPVEFEFFMATHLKMSVGNQIDESRKIETFQIQELLEMVEHVTRKKGKGLKNLREVEMVIAHMRCYRAPAFNDQWRKRSP